MPTTVKSGITNAPFIGLTNLHIAKLKEDPAGGTATYEDMISFPWIREAQIQPQNNQQTLYADNMGVATANAISRFDLTIDTATMPLEYRALLLGHSFDKGVMQVGKEDAAPYFMVAFESTKQNGKKRFVKFTKVQFTEPTEDSKTKEEQIAFNTPQLTAQAVYRTSDGVALIQADEEADGYEETTGANWYTTTATGTSSSGG